MRVKLQVEALEFAGIEGRIGQREQRLHGVSQRRRPVAVKLEPGRKDRRRLEHKSEVVALGQRIGSVRRGTEQPGLPRRALDEALVGQSF